MSASIRTFPPDFLFGAATAAFQIEGATDEDGRRDSIWDTFCREPGAIVGGDDGRVACDHYHRYRDDVALMKNLGLQTYRFSTSWARVRPDGGAVNPAGIDFYSRLVDELLDADILPWLTLYHWDLPQVLQDRGGWTVRETAERFAEYALDVHDALGDRVNVWTTLNEPWCSSFLSYTAGIHAPGHRSIEEGLLASHHLLLGHGMAVQELRERDASLNLGLTLNLTVADAVDPSDAADVDAARRIDGQFNRWFLDPVFRHVYPADVVEDIRRVDAAAIERFEAAVQPGDLDLIGAHIDTLGVNYYHGEYVSGHAPAVALPGGDAPTTRAVRSPWPSSDGIHWHDRGLDRTSMGWDIQPEGLTRLLLRVHEEYSADTGTALYVTENGAAFDDVVERPGGEAVGAGTGAAGDAGAGRAAGDAVHGAAVHDHRRVEYVREHLAAVLDAVDAGADVRGYFYWSLLDNFEWAWGYDKRFGIVYVDYATQERILKDSAHEYARIIASRTLDAVLVPATN